MSTPLRGVGVVVTRPEGQGDELAALLDAAGAQTVTMPLTRIVPRTDVNLDADLAAIAAADVVAVTSANGARLLAAAITRGAASIGPATVVAAVGDATADTLAAAGIGVDVTPQVATGSALVEALGARAQLNGAHVVLARAREGRPELPAELRKAGATVVDFALYDVEPADIDPDTLARARGCPVWVLTAPSGVDAAIDAVGQAFLATRALVSIGPTTSAHLGARGLPPAAQAAGRSAADLLDAVRSAVRPADR